MKEAELDILIVIYKFKMNNVPYRISTYDKHKIIVLKEQGLSVTDIANELGITVSLHLLLLCFKHLCIGCHALRSH